MAKEPNVSTYNDDFESIISIFKANSSREKSSSSAKLNSSDPVMFFKEGHNSLLTSGKRKSDYLNETPNTKRIRADSQPHTSTTVSPWEAKKVKIDLIAAKAQIIKLEARVNHQHTIRKEMQILFEEEKSSLADQHKRDEKSLADMEDRLQLVRRREQDAKEELNEAIKTLHECKYKWDKEKADLCKQIGELKDQLLETNASSNGQMSEMKKDMDELLQTVEGAQSEIDILKKQVDFQTSRAKQCTSLIIQVEKQSLELQQLNSKLKELEYERESYADWQLQAKTAQRRLSNMVELEKEVSRLRTTERSLRDAIGNKLLLEEQVHSLSARLEALQPVQQELHEAKVKVAHLEAALEDWVSIGRSRGAENPSALATALDNALQHEITSVTECTQTNSKLAELNEELATVKYEREKFSAKLNDLQTVRKNQESLIHRLQKRLMLVTRERDSYRQQLDCYEKELTVTLCGEPGAGNTALLTSRVEHLEKSLQGYRDLLAQNDQENNTKALEVLRAEVAKWRDEAESARRDVQKLRTQRDNLQSQIERINTPSAKVLHLVENPAAAAQKQIHTEFEAAQEEIKKLKAVLREGGSVSCTDEVASLRQQLDKSKIKLQRMKEEFTSSAQEYRDVCYMLLGYKIDRTGHKNYKLSSMYAEDVDEYLSFSLCDGGIEMVHTEYSTTLVDLVDLHLHQHHSIPLFLSALTMDLFTRTTMQQEIDD